MFRNLIAALLLLVCGVASGQIQWSAAVAYDATTPTSAPSSTGSRLRVLIPTGELYEWNPLELNWHKVPPGIDIITGTLPPSYTPTANESRFALNAAKELYFYDGAAWQVINAGGGGGGGVSSVNGLTGAVLLDLSLSGNTLSLTGDGSTVNLAPYLDNTDGQTLSFTSPNLSISGGNSVNLSAINTDAQTLTWNSATGELAISGGNTQDLDGRYLENVTDGTTVDLTKTGNNITAEIAQQGAADGQVLKWSDANGRWQPGNDIGGGAGDNWGSQVVQHDATLTGDGTASTPLGVAANGVNTSHISTDIVSSVEGVTNDGGNIDLIAGSGVSITADDGNNTITVTNTGDLSNSNELQAFSSTSNATSHTLSLTISGGSLQLIEGAGINLTSGGSGLNGTVTITNTDPDQSDTNEALTVSDGTDSEALGGQTLNFSDAGIITTDYQPGTNTILISGFESDGSPTNELQTLAYNTATDEITLSNGGGTIDITEVNTDEQTLSFTSPNLSISGGNAVNISSINTDAQTLTWNGATGELSISGGNTQDLDGRYLQTESDGSPTNELQTLAYNTATDEITLSNGGGTIDITEVNTDEQTLSFTSPNLSISGGNAVNISSINTDAQTLAWNGATGELSISGGNVADLDGRYLENVTDGTTVDLTKTGNNITAEIAQQSATDGQVLKWSDANGRWQPGNDVGGGATTDLGFTGAVSPVTLTSSTGADVTFTAGSNITLTATSTNLTIAASGGGGSPSVITPSQITSTQNDYSPTGWADATHVRLSFDSDIDGITGFEAQSDGETKVLFNVGTEPGYISAQNANSTAANRVAQGALLEPGGSVTIVYDGTSSLWRVQDNTWNASKVGISTRGQHFIQFPGSTNQSDHPFLGFATSGTGSGNANIAPTSTKPSGWEMLTGTTASGISTVYLPKNNNAFTAFGSAMIIAWTEVGAPALSTSSQRYTLQSSVLPGANATTLAVNNSCGCRYSDNINNGEWECYTRNSAGTETTLDTNIAFAANEIYAIRIYVNKSCTEVWFQINQTHVGTITTNLPTSGTLAGIRTGIWKSVGTTTTAGHVYGISATSIYSN